MKHTALNQERAKHLQRPEGAPELKPGAHPASAGEAPGITIKNGQTPGAG